MGGHRIRKRLPVPKKKLRRDTDHTPDRLRIASAPCSSLKIQGTYSLFTGLAFDGVRIDHGGFDIAVPQQFLDRANVVIGLQQVTGKAVAKSVG